MTIDVERLRCKRAESDAYETKVQLSILRSKREIEYIKNHYTRLFKKHGYSVIDIKIVDLMIYLYIKKMGVEADVEIIESFYSNFDMSKELIIEEELLTSLERSESERYRISSSNETINNTYKDTLNLLTLKFNETINEIMLLKNKIEKYMSDFKKESELIKYCLLSLNATNTFNKLISHKNHLYFIANEAKRISKIINEKNDILFINKKLKVVDNIINELRIEIKLVNENSGYNDLKRRKKLFDYIEDEDDEALKMLLERFSLSIENAKKLAYKTDLEFGSNKTFLQANPTRLSYKTEIGFGANNTFLQATELIKSFNLCESIAKEIKYEAEKIYKDVDYINDILEETSDYINEIYDEAKLNVGRLECSCNKKGLLYFKNNKLNCECGYYKFAE